jgi:hypothetical protein
LKLSDELLSSSDLLDISKKLEYLMKLSLKEEALEYLKIISHNQED